MKEILNLIKMDFITVKDKSLFPTAIIVVILCIFGFMLFPQFITIVTFISPLMFISLFSISEKNNFNKLYGTLPIDRNYVVLSRFLGTGILITVTSLVAFVLSSIAFNSEIYLNWNSDNIKVFTSLSTLINDKGLSIAICTAIMFVITCIFVGTTYLIDFIFGTEKEAQMTVIVMIIVLGIIAFLKYVVKTEIMQSLIDFCQNFYGKSHILFLIFVYVTGLVFLSIFAFITNFVVSKREL